MEDKIIIKSERYNVKKIFLYVFILGIIAFAIIFSTGTASWFERHRRFWGSSTLAEQYFAIDEIFNPIKFFGSTFYCLICPLSITVIIYYWLKSYELTITDKRAYGFAAFGRRADLPVDSISAIGLGWLKSIKITTASGKISFKLIKNRDEMYETISKLIVERQNKGTKTETIVKQETSNADELKKYKDLLDSGVITQEEFDAKKKQLLGL